MSIRYPYFKKIDLHVKGRISEEDARRQERTTKEILKRLVKRPGLILADEVGMGKTFVALAVAVSVAVENKGKRPVVVMVPSSLKEKWPTDFELFKEKCLPREVAAKVKCGRAERAVEFLKLLDDPPERRKSVIFATHGAMSRNLSDSWVRLALIYQAIKGRTGVKKFKNILKRVLGPLLYMKWVEKNGEDIWLDLLNTHPSEWLSLLHEWGIDPENDNDPETDDDPVPKAVCDILHKIDTSSIYEALLEIPYRRSKYFEEKLRNVRQIIVQEMRLVWKECIQHMKLRLPLLILDEAHHLKNSQTQLASLFRDPDSRDDAEEVTRGALGGVFSRMIFLTATPFQLGHAELCSVLDRFAGISWKKKTAPACGKDGFLRQLDDLREALDSAQEAAVTLDASWGRLQERDLILNGEKVESVEEWWAKVKVFSDISPQSEQVLRCYSRTDESMKVAEALLKPWVIRHLKPRYLPAPHINKTRRRRFAGGSICLNGNGDHQSGIPVEGNALLPFLLAARATTCTPNSRPVFAEGLASSYEAFMHTRQNRLQSFRKKNEHLIDVDDDYLPEEYAVTDSSRWYLDKLGVCRNTPFRGVFTKNSC